LGLMVSVFLVPRIQMNGLLDIARVVESDRCNSIHETNGRSGGGNEMPWSCSMRSHLAWWGRWIWCWRVAKTV
jgi:hypothetical protein